MNRYELLRYEAGLSLTEAATASGVAVGAIRSLERGDTGKPQAGTAKALADTYGVSVSRLLGLPEAKAA